MPGFGEKLSKFASNTKKQAQELLETNKLKSAIRKEEESIEKAYFQIGQIYFDTYKEDGEIPANFRQMLDGVLASKQNIEDLNLQIEELSGIKKCPQCGEETEREKPFCGSCGYKFDEQPQASQTAPVNTAQAAPVVYEEIPPQSETEQEQVEPTQGTWPPPGQSEEPAEPEAPAQEEKEKMVCASCGNPLEEGAKFCGSCGQKVE